MDGIAKGDAVLVHGQLVRRFYRSGAGARSLTEVVATGIKKLEQPRSASRRWTMHRRSRAWWRLAGFATPQQEFGRLPKPNFLEEEPAQGQRAEAEKRAEAELLKEAQRVLGGEDG